MSKGADRPYPGPRPFRQADRDRLYGRTAESALLAEWWQHNNVSYIVGPAGCGKTSVLLAGVLPLLATENVTALPVGRLSYAATFPSAALPGQNPYTLSLLCSWAPDEVVTRLAGLTVSEFIQRRGGDRTVLAAIDQADELLADTGPRQAHRHRFLDELKEAVRTTGLHLLVVARAEAADVMAEILGHGVRRDLAPLSWPGALDAVSGPIAGTGRSIDDEAAGALVTSVQTSRIVSADGSERYVSDKCVELALLQVVCAHLWDALPPDLDRITTREVRRYGDADTALAAWCGMVIARVADDHDLPARRVISWLLGNFVTEDGTRDKKREGPTATAGMPSTLLRRLEDGHLLRARPEPGSRWYELLSDRVIEPLRKAAKADEVPRSPARPEDHIGAAGHALTLGDPDLAKRYAEEVLRTPLQSGVRLHAQAYSLLGNLEYERDKPEKAEKRYREAMRLFGAAGDNRAVVDQLAAVGQTLLAQGRVQEAVDELYVAVRRMPNDLAVKTQLARALWQYGDGRDAVTFLNDVLRVDGGNRAALQARGEILAYLGDARRAMLDLDRVTLRGQPSTRAARGLALAELGDQPAARREIEAAVDEGRWNGLALLYAARAFQTGGDDRAAKEYARKAANATDPPLSPRHREVARQLAGYGRG
jgi:tetratricopeptide (TPR) repeat protein